MPALHKAVISCNLSQSINLSINVGKSDADGQELPQGPMVDSTGRVRHMRGLDEKLERVEKLGSPCCPPPPSLRFPGSYLLPNENLSSTPVCLLLLRTPSLPYFPLPSFPPTHTEVVIRDAYVVFNGGPHEGHCGRVRRLTPDGVEVDLAISDVVCTIRRALFMHYLFLGVLDQYCFWLIQFNTLDGAVSREPGDGH
jgi:hypothetical protein